LLTSPQWYSGAQVENETGCCGDSQSEGHGGK
jgi:hypothetical protein